MLHKQLSTPFHIGNQQICYKNNKDVIINAIVENLIAYRPTIEDAQFKNYLKTQSREDYVRIVSTSLRNIYCFNNGRYRFFASRLESGRILITRLTYMLKNQLKREFDSSVSAIAESKSNASLSSASHILSEIDISQLQTAHLNIGQLKTVLQDIEKAPLGHAKNDTEGYAAFLRNVLDNVLHDGDHRCTQVHFDCILILLRILARRSHAIVSQQLKVKLSTYFTSHHDDINSFLSPESKLNLYNYRQLADLQKARLFEHERIAIYTLFNQILPDDLKILIPELPPIKGSVHKTHGTATKRPHAKTDYKQHVNGVVQKLRQCLNTPDTHNNFAKAVLSGTDTQTDSISSAANIGTLHFSDHHSTEVFSYVKTDLSSCEINNYYVVVFVLDDKREESYGSVATAYYGKLLSKENGKYQFDFDGDVQVIAENSDVPIMSLDEFKRLFRTCKNYLHITRTPWVTEITDSTEFLYNPDDNLEDAVNSSILAYADDSPNPSSSEDSRTFTSNEKIPGVTPNRSRKRGSVVVDLSDSDVTDADGAGYESDSNVSVRTPKEKKKKNSKR